MEKIEALLESSKYAPLSASDSASMKLMLENAEREQNQLLSEGTLSGDVAQFSPILMPLVRRVYPNLIANELLGVQAMTMPTGYIYALTNEYKGTDNNKSVGNGKTSIIELDASTSLALGETVTGDTSGATGEVAYKEDNKVLLVNIVGTFVAEPINTGSETITGVFSNEAAFRRILKGYTGTYTTGQAEVLGKDMREMGFSISRKSVEAVSRALKGQYSVELYQDLKAQHGLQADEEIMSLMGYEMQAEMDREVVDFVNNNASQLSDTTFSTDYSDGGRWEIEKYRAQAIRVSKEAAQIGIDTKRGQGNVLVVSPKVATMLEQVGSFKNAPVQSNVDAPVSGGVAGTFDGRFKVVVDQFAVSDYCTVLYKGQDRRDAMGFLSTYVPMSFTKVTHADSGQPAVIAKSRYALSTIPGASSPDSNDRAQTYARSFGVDFTNTVLAG
jgi:hypothetical protein